MIDFISISFTMCAWCQRKVLGRLNHRACAVTPARGLAGREWERRCGSILSWAFWGLLSVNNKNRKDDKKSYVFCHMTNKKLSNIIIEEMVNSLEHIWCYKCNFSFKKTNYSLSKNFE